LVALHVDILESSRVSRALHRIRGASRVPARLPYLLHLPRHRSWPGQRQRRHRLAAEQPEL